MEEVTLPVELIECILSKCETIDELCRHRLVCTTWNDLISLGSSAVWLSLLCKLFPFCSSRSGSSTIIEQLKALQYTWVTIYITLLTWYILKVNPMSLTSPAHHTLRLTCTTFFQCSGNTGTQQNTSPTTIPWSN